MRKEIQARRYDVHGRDVEEVQIAISKIGDSVHLHINGQKVSKNYIISLPDWERLTGN